MKRFLPLRAWRLRVVGLLVATMVVLPGSATAASLGATFRGAISLAGSSPNTTPPLPLPASLAWGWPVTTASGGRPRVAHYFDPPDKPWLSGHRGVDLLALQGATIRAPAAGVVTFSGVVVDRPVLTIATSDGLRLSFEPVKSSLKVGTAVARGSVLGTLSGPTHCDNGPPGEGSCLHWGVRRGDDYLDPLAFILDLRPSVLLPLE
ncbi:MAG: M23 family metallopeptidase [Specibacter sp.]